MLSLSGDRNDGFEMPLRMTIVALATIVLVLGAAEAQTFSVIHNFTGLGEDGANPYAGLAMDRAGNLYGTTEYGGNGPCRTQYTQGCGTVFKMAHHGSGWYYQPLYNFQGWLSGDGAYPSFGGLTIGPDGSFYGTTLQGGVAAGCQGSGTCGTVFNVKPSPTRPPSVFSQWTEKVLYSFQQAPDGNFPEGKLAFDSAGNLYGTTIDGGTYYYYWGTAFELTPSAGGQWAETIIHSFGNGQDGEEPFSGLFADQAGNLYGTTFTGGPSYYGVVFQLSKSEYGWTETVIHNFGSDGTRPYATLISDSSGNLYGSTTDGEPNGDAVVFELSPSNGGWTYSILHIFPMAYDGGPAAPLMMDAAGNLYGTTKGQNNPFGSVFKLSPYNGGWTYTLLHQFTDGSDGANPYSNEVMDAQGDLYGTASAGGSSTYCPGGCGVVWEITQ